MGEELSSTNINDLINDDTDVNDDVVDKILNELENTEQDNIIHSFDDNNSIQQVPLEPINEDYALPSNSYFRESDFNNLMKDNTANETDSTVKKINSILDLDVDYNFSVLDFILKDFKNPIIIIIIVLITNNIMILNLLESLLSSISNSSFLNNNISLIFRALISGIIFYFIQKLI
tara:strand:+ start:77 stop:604 length:528 start_codon:yes stop_codon:yes gene_type:complete